MPTSRAAIRAAVIQIIKDSGYTDPINDQDSDDKNFLEVGFLIGDEVAAGLLSDTVAILEVGIFSTGASDDAIDTIAQPIEDALKVANPLGTLVKGFTYSGFEYPDVDERLGAIVLKFSIKY